MGSSSSGQRIITGHADSDGECSGRSTAATHIDNSRTPDRGQDESVHTAQTTSDASEGEQKLVRAQVISDDARSLEAAGGTKGAPTPLDEQSVMEAGGNTSDAREVKPKAVTHGISNIETDDTEEGGNTSDTREEKPKDVTHGLSNIETDKVADSLDKIIDNSKPFVREEDKVKCDKTVINSPGADKTCDKGNECTSMQEIGGAEESSNCCDRIEIADNDTVNERHADSVILVAHPEGNIAISMENRLDTGKLRSSECSEKVKGEQEDVLESVMEPTCNSDAYREVSYFARETHNEPVSHVNILDNQTVSDVNNTDRCKSDNDATKCVDVTQKAHREDDTESTVAQQQVFTTDTGGTDAKSSNTCSEKDEVTEKKADLPKSNHSSTGKTQKSDENPGINVQFYRNVIKSKPHPGSTIEEMLKWKGDYKKLESNHRYIQWLFPTSEGGGMNPSAHTLQEAEAKTIREDRELRGRVLRAYQMMLDFYGLELVSPERLNGNVKRKRGDWKSRFEHLNKSYHNLMRISRILKSVGELGMDYLQAPLVSFLLEEAVKHKTMPKLAGGNVKFWIDAISDDDQRGKLQYDYFDLYVSAKDSKSKAGLVVTKPDLASAKRPEATKKSGTNLVV